MCVREREREREIEIDRERERVERILTERFLHVEHCQQLTEPVALLPPVVKQKISKCLRHALLQRRERDREEGGENGRQRQRDREIQMLIHVFLKKHVYTQILQN